MICPVCKIKRFLKEDIDCIKQEGYCTSCNDMERYFTDDESITEEEAIAEGLTIVNDQWFEREQEDE